jgi:hypothetical protein
MLMLGLITVLAGVVLTVVASSLLFLGIGQASRDWDILDLSSQRFAGSQKHSARLPHAAPRPSSFAARSEPQLQHGSSVSFRIKQAICNTACTCSWAASFS